MPEKTKTQGMRHPLFIAHAITKFGDKEWSYNLIFNDHGIKRHHERSNVWKASNFQREHGYNDQYGIELEIL